MVPAANQLEEHGMFVTGKHEDPDLGLDLVEIVEIKGHPFFIGCQFHPEFLSKPLRAHPLFQNFIHYAVKNQKADKSE